jgi:hypothetical protein
MAAARTVLAGLRWPAEDSAPPVVPPHDEDTALSLVGWVKRRWAYLNDENGFLSTASIASAPCRRAVLEHLADEDVRAALADFARAARAVETTPEAPVPGLAALTPDSGPGRWLVRRGGPWVYPDRWQPEGLAREMGIRKRGSKAASRDELARMAEIADAGRKVVAHLRDVMAQRGVHLADHLAVVVQDVDSMGRFLSGAASDAPRRKPRSSRTSAGDCPPLSSTSRRRSVPRRDLRTCSACLLTLMPRGSARTRMRSFSHRRNTLSAIM